MSFHERLEEDTGAQDSDLELYEQFLRETTNASTATQSSAQDENEVIREALNEMLDTIEREVQHNRTNRRNGTARIEVNESSATPGAVPLASVGEHLHSQRNGNASGRREPLFVQRRPYLRTFIRNLLLLDYFFMLLLFPFSLYNILRFGFSSVTLSQSDFILDILVYCQTTTDFAQLHGRYKLREVNMDLLGKFHNIVVYYSWPAFRRLLLNYMPQNWVQQSLLQAYQLLVKTTAITMYLVYGVGGTVYLAIAGFFFTICIAVTVSRRYKHVQRIIAASLESSAALPGMF